MPSLLAVDLGLKTGLALFSDDGRLVWYRSRHFGTPAGLRRAVRGLLGKLSDRSRLVIEGGGPLAEIWTHQAQRRGMIVQRIAAEDWRRLLLYPREHRDTDRAKRSAVTLARKVIEWSEVRRPSALRHDTAEAILIGLWGVLDAGWLKRPPAEIRG